MSSLSPANSRPWRLHSVLSILVLTSSVLNSVVEAQPFVRLCMISPYSVMSRVAHDGDEDEYFFVRDGAINASSGNHRGAGLRQLQVQQQQSSQEAPVPSFFIPPDRQRQLATGERTNTSDPILVRQCPCALDTYCPINTDTCGVPASYTEPIGCFAQSTQKTLLRNAWPLLMLWYCTVAFFLLCTEKGRNARNYMMLKVCNSHRNEQIVDRFLYAHGFISTNPFPNEAQPAQDGDNTNTDNHSQRPLNWLPIARAVEPREPTELVLKTRIFSEADATACSGDEDDDCCTICFSQLEVGERVGKLPCSHTFHVECLRNWLPRRNVCPLCQTSNAATPRYSDRDNEDDSNSEGGISTASDLAAAIARHDNSNSNNSDPTQFARVEIDAADLRDVAILQASPAAAAVREEATAAVRGEEEVPPPPRRGSSTSFSRRMSRRLEAVSALPQI